MSYVCKCANGKTWGAGNQGCNTNASNCAQCCSGEYGGVASGMISLGPYRSSTGTRGQTAPFGYRYMPDGRLVSMTPTYAQEPPTKKSGIKRISKIITGINLDFSDIKEVGEVRKFTVLGSSGAVFSLEVRDCNPSTGVCTYYNFQTNSFQATKTGLNNISISGGSYHGNIAFPESATANQYDIFLFAESIYGTRHSRYSEVRFADKTIDINSSKGSNSNLVQKVIYQTLDVDITISGHSPNSTITHQGSIVTQTITTSRGKNNAKIPFSIPWTVTNTRTLTIDRQPKVGDVTSYVTRAIGIEPVNIPGEDLGIAIKGAGTNTVDGTGNESGATTTITMDNVAAGTATVGYRITGNDWLEERNVTIISVSTNPNKTIVASVAPVIADGTTLTFTRQLNYRWSLDDIYGLKPGMKIYATDTIGLANGFTKFATIKGYLTQLTGFDGERIEYKIDDINLLGIETYGIKPTITRDSSTHVVTTTQPGDVIFSQQAYNALGGSSMLIYGYGRSEINSLTEYDIEFSDLKVTLSEVSTLVKGTVSASTTVEVDSGVGIKENISTVSGIGIDSTAIAPTITRLTDDGGSSTWASGAARLTLSAAQTLEDNMSLTFSGASTVATITGNIKINKVGNADVAIYFDLEKFLTMQAANA